MQDNLFLRFSISELLDKVSEGSLTPKDLSVQCIKAIEEYNDTYKVFVCYDREILFKQAEITTKRLNDGGRVRALEGIPVGIKDIFNTYEFPTQMGSPLWSGFTSGNDSRVVYYLKEAGAVIPGKTDTAEFAVHAIGNCLNPHDIKRTPGTSSSGSAVSVLLGMVPAAIGTQTAGSIVRPASFCGVYGCKPSFGLIPRTGMLKTTDSLDSIGFFTSKYSDLERMFEIIRVHGPNFPISNDALNDEIRQNKSSSGKWRVAFVKTHTWESAYGYAKEKLEEFVKKISTLDEIEIEEVNLPGTVVTSHEVHQNIYDKTLSYYFQEEFKKPEQVSAIMKEIFQRGNRISVKEYHKALKDQEEIIHSVDSFFEKYDVIISLSTAGEAPLREEPERPDPSLIWTLSHLPVISAPVFRSPNGLPFGVQFATRKYNDLLLFRFTDYLRENEMIPAGSDKFGTLNYTNK